MKNKIKIIIFLIIIVVFIFIFKPFKLEKVLSTQINYSDIISIKINELVNAYVSNDYTIETNNQIIEIYNKISNLKVRRCIFTPKDYSIQPNKTYRITMFFINKVLIISINTDGQNQYITVDNKTYKIISID